MRAVENALEALDEAAEDTPEGGGVAGEFDAGAGDGNGGDEGARPQQDRSLQRAGLAQRLSDLLAKKQQWKARASMLAIGLGTEMLTHIRVHA